MPTQLKDLGEVKPRRAPDFGFLKNGKPWLLKRGEDFPEMASLRTLKQQIRRWADAEGLTRERGYIIKTVTVIREPKTGKAHGKLGGRRDASSAGEFGLGVQVVQDRALAKHRLERARHVARGRWGKRAAR